MMSYLLLENYNSSFPLASCFAYQRGNQVLVKQGVITPKTIYTILGIIKQLSCMEVFPCRVLEPSWCQKLENLSI